MKTVFGKSWTDWINTNLNRGCSETELQKILEEAGFCPKLINNFPGFTTANTSSDLPKLPTDEERVRMSYRMSDSILLPGATRITNDLFVKTDETNTPRVKLYCLDDFLSESECQELISIIKGKLEPSIITTSEERDKAFRTSRTCHLGNLQEACLQQLDHRICEYMGIEPSRSEGIQGQHYRVGEEFKAHTDYFTPHTQEYQTYASNQGQRTWTFMIYLNDVPLGNGGDTEFVNLGMSFQPKRGQAIIWNNLLPDGSPNPDTLHWAHQVTRGEKTIITKWFRQYGELTSNFLPRLDKMLVPFSEHGFIVKDYSSDLLHTLSTNIPPLISDWLQIPLEPVRYYKVNIDLMVKTKSRNRTDYQSEIFTAIINIDKTHEVHLSVCDHMERWVDLILQPNQLLIYESARLQLQYKSGGESIVSHTMPLGWSKIASVFTRSLQQGMCHHSRYPDQLT